MKETVAALALGLSAALSFEMLLPWSAGMSFVATACFAMAVLDSDF